MSSSNSGRARVVLGCIYSLTSSVVIAQEAVTPLPPVVVTATRGPLDVARAGSAIDVVTHDDIERLGATSLRDALQAVPGLYIHDGGGAGSTSNVTLRASNPGQTLVLMDGVRIGDPTGTDGAFDFGTLALGDIERIEVLRGPQSALYGSDAMGGVVQIITRKGEGPPRKSVAIEGGAYGTLRTRASISGGADTVSYAFSVDALHSDGFPRYGYRANHPVFLLDGVTPLPAAPGGDATNRAGVSGRVSYKLGEATEVEVGFSGSSNRLSIDNPYVFAPSDVFSPFNASKESSGQAYAKVVNHAFDGRLTNQLTLFGGALDRVIAQTESCPEDYVSNCWTNYRGVRVGAEYQGDLKLGGLGQLTFGLRNETERAFFSHDLPLNLGGGHVADFSGQQTTNSVFGLYQFTLFDRLDLSLAGREDSVVEGRSFLTGRATAAWRLNDSGTKLRASLGSGAKIPTLYQRYSVYGDPTLKPEENVGVDAGVDQSLLNDRLRLSASVFSNSYRNLIGFNSAVFDPGTGAFTAPGCAPAQQMTGCYYNVGRATTRGVEFSATADIVPEEWRATASYTYMDAINKITSQGLMQQPRHKAVGSLVYTGVPKLRLEGRMTVVGGVIDFGSTAPVRLPAYYRLDAYANYRLDDHVTLFARLENLTDARYVEIYNYGVAGRSLYAGLKVDW